MKRLTFDQLESWAKSEQRKPLILRGARQVGKTYSVEQLGREYFSNNILKVDFEERPSLKDLFRQDLDVRVICAELELRFEHKIIPGQTLLFFDEVQQCPRSIMALRYFYEQMPELHVIAAGSLVEFVLEDISFPVGRVQFLEMQPMTYEEFLMARGKEQLLEILNADKLNISETAHRIFREELKQYFFVGGWPKAVEAFVQTGSVLESMERQKEIVKAYRQDFHKYSQRANVECLDEILISCSRFVGKQIVYSKLSEGYTSKTIKKNLYLLRQAQLVSLTFSAHLMGNPLGLGVNHKRLKCVLADMGLMHQLNDLTWANQRGETDLLAIYEGALAEQFVGQELLAALGDRDLYYWSRNSPGSTAEVDFLCHVQGRILPIEVKSGPSGRMKSLHLFLKENPEVEWGYVFYDGPYQKLEEQKLIFCPLYLVSRMIKTKGVKS